MDAEREKMLADAWARAEDEITHLRQQVATITKQRDMAAKMLDAAEEKLVFVEAKMDESIALVGQLKKYVEVTK